MKMQYKYLDKYNNGSVIRNLFYTYNKIIFSSDNVMMLVNILNDIMEFTDDVTVITKYHIKRECNSNKLALLLNPNDINSKISYLDNNTYVVTLIQDKEDVNVFDITIEKYDYKEPNIVDSSNDNNSINYTYSNLVNSILNHSIIMIEDLNKSVIDRVLDFNNSISVNNLDELIEDKEAIKKKDYIVIVFDMGDVTSLRDIFIELINSNIKIICNTTFLHLFLSLASGVEEVNYDATVLYKDDF